MQSRCSQSGTISIGSELAIGGLVLLGGLLYLYLWVDPSLVYHAQEGAFLMDWSFAWEFLRYPGGVQDLLGRLLSQALHIRLLGSAMIVVMIGSVWYGLYRLGGRIDPEGMGRYLCWIPSTLLLGLHADYSYPLAITLGVLITVIVLNIYAKLMASASSLRLLAFCLIDLLLYYALAGGAFWFATAAVLLELTVCRRFFLSIVYVLICLSIPYLLASTVFILHMPDAYTAGLVVFSGYKLGWMAWTVYGSIILCLVLCAVHLRYKLRIIAWILAVICALFVAWLCYDKQGKKTILVDYHASRRNWQDVLAIAGKQRVNIPYVQYQINRALYHTGLLLDRMFEFAQYPDGSSLFMKGQICQVLPLRHSDIFMDLGLVNEAEHWAHEAVEVKGYTGPNLCRLIEVNLLKSEWIVAGKYLKMLKRTFWRGSDADRYSRYLADPNQLAKDQHLGPTQRLMPKDDFLLSPDHPEFCLVELVKDPSNRMAFEYYMAQCLIAGDLKGLTRYIWRLEQLGYTHVPRHIEEAILILMQLPTKVQIPLTKLQISDHTINRFNEFNRILARFSGDRDAARQDLLRYADTYWFYWQYVVLPRGAVG